MPLFNMKLGYRLYIYLRGLLLNFNRITYVSPIQNEKVLREQKLVKHMKRETILTLGSHAL